MSKADLGPSVGAMVRALRERALLSQDELAARSGLSVGTIRGLESGRIRRPRISSVRQLADSLALQGEEREMLVAAARGDAADRGADLPVALPAQLPVAVSGFAGRADALKALDDMLSREDTGLAPVVITAIAGTAGVGKTALAVHWAHRVADRFPDGQLYVNLRGFDATASPALPAGVVRSFLETLGTPAHRIPSTVDGQVGLFRSLLAGRRILILLDNARDPEQVRPLLPGTPGSLVLITSRSELSGLVATEGARPLALGLLPQDEARDLLVLRLGAGRVAAQGEAVDAIIRSCAGLPLALAIVAARAAIHADLPLSALAAQLADAHGRLDALSGRDPVTDVRAVFSWSYRTLTGPAARLFRLIGLHPGPDLTAAAAVALAEPAAGQARRCLAELAATHLVTEHTPGRYAMHDLLRVYASELAHTTDSGTERHAALRRLLDHYLHTTYAANSYIRPMRHPPAVSPPQPGVPVTVFGSYQEALQWCATEHPVLLAVIKTAAEHGFDTHAWQLAREASASLGVRGLWHDNVALGRLAVSAAQHGGDPAGQAHAHRVLGVAAYRLGRHADARDHITRSLELFTAVADEGGQGWSHVTLGVLSEQDGDLDAALAHAQHAFEIFRSLDDIDGKAQSLNGIGWTYSMRGDHRHALAYCGQALALYRELGAQTGEAYTLHSIGHAHQQLGDHPKALDCFRQTMTLVRATGDRYLESWAFAGIGDSHLAEGRPEAAQEAWRQSWRILAELDHPGAAEMAAKLEAI